MYTKVYIRLAGRAFNLLSPKRCNMAFLQASSFTPRPIEYLWPARLPLGYLTLLDGDPYQGKSMIAVDLSARVTTGQAWPDGAPGGLPANVVLINAEDGVRDVLPKRLIAAGADMSRVFLWEHTPTEPWLRLPSQRQQLDDVVV